ncbi:MAG: hypothetical protein SP1CHLAM54_14690 [Chlamydiia bacterium]|nr:hypothetical protein [Chlamydiia bacterium]MCH9616359.1 hypothetical protein [Chlamydiia bacterium]MCH9629655.1 hypothetical protein [Chlamydiia bacterium]
MKFSSLLNKRLKNEKNVNKMSALAERSNSGQLSSFSGVFQVGNISEKEKASLETILSKYSVEQVDIQEDLRSLTQITAEVKAISNQAAMLHGERIQKAKELFAEYSDGAFSAWLMETYGNRQTPYNFLLFYEFYNELPESLQEKVDEMPKQVIYTLSSRKASLEAKEKFVKSYKGETKAELLKTLRKSFPLATHDKRSGNQAGYTLSTLKRLVNTLHQEEYKPSTTEKKKIGLLLEQLKRINESA